MYHRVKRNVSLENRLPWAGHRQYPQMRFEFESVVLEKLLKFSEPQFAY